MGNPVEILWKDTCNVYTKGKTIDPIDHSTKFGDVVLYENKKCRISRNTKDVTLSDGSVMAKGQGIMLYISDELTIPSGSKISVTHMGHTIDYTRSGEPFYYEVTKHQEIPLKLFEKYA